MLSTTRAQGAGLACLIVLFGGCSDLMLVTDYRVYGTVCNELAHFATARCAERNGQGAEAMVDCQVGQLKRAGIDAINHDGEPYCIEPFRPFQNTTAQLFHHCPYLLVRAESECTYRLGQGHADEIKACVIEAMANPPLAGAYGISSISSFELGKGYGLKPGSEAEFQCVDEVASRGG